MWLFCLSFLCFVLVSKVFSLCVSPLRLSPLNIGIFVLHVNYALQILNCEVSYVKLYKKVINYILYEHLNHKLMIIIIVFNLCMRTGEGKQMTKLNDKRDHISFRLVNVNFFKLFKFCTLSNVMKITVSVYSNQSRFLGFA